MSRAWPPPPCPAPCSLMVTKSTRNRSATAPCCRTPFPIPHVFSGSLGWPPHLTAPMNLYLLPIQFCQAVATPMPSLVTRRRVELRFGGKEVSHGPHMTRPWTQQPVPPTACRRSSDHH
jgi:hypothetical protein